MKGFLLGMSLPVLLLFGCLVAAAMGYRLQWAQGDSLPYSLFLCHTPSGPLARGAYVLFTVPQRFRDEVAQVAPGVQVPTRWIKQVWGGEGDEICWEDAQLRINRRTEADLLLYSSYPFSPKHGCLTLGADDLFVLGTHPHSVDSRYLGPLQTTEVDRVCRALW